MKIFRLVPSLAQLGLGSSSTSLRLVLKIRGVVTTVAILTQKKWQSAHPASASVGLHWNSGRCCPAFAGSALLGEMPRSDTYRMADVQAELSLKDLLSTASGYVSEILQSPSRPPHPATVVWAKTEKEIAAGLMSEPMTRETVNAIWGPGLWRPAIRFATVQKRNLAGD